MDGCLVVQNGVDLGGVNLRGWCAAELHNCTIAANQCLSPGAGVRVSGTSTAELAGCILRDNCAINAGAADVHVEAGGAIGIYCCALDSAGLQLEGSTRFGPTQWYGDPKFCRPATCHDAFVGDFGLQPDSPCRYISACYFVIGANRDCGQVWPPGLLRSDVEEGARPR